MAKKRRAIPNFFTIGNMMGGILAILFALTGKIEWAPYCIFIAIIFDFFDGFMAGLLKAKSDKGKQLDSLADIVTFGVSPGVMMFVMLQVLYPGVGSINIPLSDIYSGQGLGSNFNSIEAVSIEFIIIPYLAFIIPIFALFRLAKYNIDTKQSTSFIGVPTATMAIFFASFPLLIKDAATSQTDFKNWVLEYIFLNPPVLLILTVLFSVLMVVKIPLIALKFKTYKWVDNEIRYIFLGLCLISIITLKFWSIPVIVILYILISLVNNMTVKSKTQK